MEASNCTCQGRPADPNTLYTVAEAARLLRFSEKTVRRMIARREIGSIRTNGSIRLHRRHLEAWQHANDVPALGAGRAA